MICSRCEAAQKQRPSDPAARRTASAFGSERVSGVICDRCGALLPLDSTENLLAKLSQLARFGLAAEGRPLLESSREGR
jgi:ribosomal protein L40E